MKTCAHCGGTDFKELDRVDRITRQAARARAKNNHVWFECVGCGSEYRENIVHAEKETTP